MIAAQSEIAIQTLFRSRCRIMCPGVSLVAVPNAAKRSQWAAQRAKREGLAKGAPDMICAWDGGGVAWIEFKAAKGRVSPDQEDFIERLRGHGHSVVVARSADEGIEFLRSCGAPFLPSVFD